MKTRLNLTILTSFVNLALKSLALILLTPFLVKVLDDSQLFIWYFLSTIYSIIMLLDLGFLPTISRYVTRFSKTYENEKLLTTVKKIYFALSVIIFLIATLSSFFYLKSKSDLVFENSYYINLLAYTVICSVGLYTNVYTSILHGLNKIIEIQLVQIFGTVLGIVFSLFTLFYFENAFYTAISFYFGQIFSFFILRYRCEVNLKYISTSREVINDFVFNVKDLILDSLKCGFGVLFSLGILHFSSLFVTYSMDVADSSSYLFLVQVFRAVISFSQPIFYTKIPTINKMYNQTKCFKTVIDYSKLYFLLSIFSYLILVFIAYIVCEVYFTVFDGAKLRSDISIWGVFGVAFLIERACSMMLQIYTSTGKVIWHKINGITGFSICVIMLCFYLTNCLDEFSYPTSVFLSYSLIFLPIITLYSFKELKIGNEK